MSKSTLSKIEHIYGYVEQGDASDLDVAWNTFLKVLEHTYSAKVPEGEHEPSITMFFVGGDLAKILTTFVNKYKVADINKKAYCSELCKILLTYIRCEKFPVGKGTFIGWLKTCSLSIYLEECKDSKTYYNDLWECIILLRYIILEKILPKTYRDYGCKVYISNIVYPGPRDEIVFLISTELMLRSLGITFEDK